MNSRRMSPGRFPAMARRWPVLATAVLVMVAWSSTGVGPDQLRASAVKGPASGRVDWPKFHMDLANSGWNRLESTIGPANVATLVQDWSVHTGAVQGAIALHDGVLFTVSLMAHIPTSTVITALRATSGAVLWQHRVKHVGAIYGLAYAQGRVFFGTDDYVFHALDARTGQSLWDAPAGGISTNPAVARGLVYFGATDGVLHALHASTGEVAWTFRAGGGSIGPCPAVVGGVVYVGAGDGKLYALDALTGAVLWAFQTGAPIDRSSPAVVRGVVYVASDNMNLYALDAATGSLRWSVSTGPLLYNAPPSPAVANGVVYSSATGVMEAFSAIDGTQLWSQPLAASTGSPVVANGVLYVPGQLEGSFWALDASTGEILWSVTAGGEFSDGAQIVANGMVFAGSLDQYLYAFSPAG